jgi:hypothetical protein
MKKIAVTLMIGVCLVFLGSETYASRWPFAPATLSEQQITVLIKLADHGDVDAQVQLAAHVQSRLYRGTLHYCPI